MQLAVHLTTNNMSCIIGEQGNFIGGYELFALLLTLLALESNYITQLTASRGASMRL
jgi:hypothetical protein